MGDQPVAAPIGCGAIVRTLTDTKVADKPAGAIGLVVRQASNGPNRYSVMFPGDPFQYSLAAKDVEVLRGLDPQPWWKKQPASSSSDAPNQTATGPVVDSELRDLLAVALSKHPHLSNDWSDDPQAYLSNGVVATILDVVAPVLAAKDKRIASYEHLIKHAKKIEDMLRSQLEQHREELQRALGVNPLRDWDDIRNAAAGLRKDRDALRAQLAEDERDKANRQNESLARRLHLRFQSEEKLRAELDALKAKAAEDKPWNDAIDWLLNSRHTADPDIQTAFWGMVDGKLTRDQAGNGVFELDENGDLIASGSGQPDTEATEQADDAVLLAVATARATVDTGKRYPLDDVIAEQAEPCGAVGLWGTRNNRYECDRPKGHTEQLHENSSEEPPVIWFGDHAEQPAAPATPTEPRDVYHDPGDVQYEYDEDDNPISPSVGWDIAFGCRVTFGHDDDGWRVSVSVSDAERRNGGSIRACDRHQIRAFAYHLIQLTEVVEDQPNATTEPREWRTGDAEPPADVHVLHGNDELVPEMPYLCRFPSDPTKWGWFHEPSERFAADLPKWKRGATWTDALGAACGPLTEVVEDGAQAGGGQP